MSFDDDDFNPFNGFHSGCELHGEDFLRECTMCGAEFCAACFPQSPLCPDCVGQMDFDDDEETMTPEEKEISLLVGFDEEDFIEEPANGAPPAAPPAEEQPPSPRAKIRRPQNPPAAKRQPRNRRQNSRSKAAPKRAAKKVAGKKPAVKKRPNPTRAEDQTRPKPNPLRTPAPPKEIILGGAEGAAPHASDGFTYNYWTSAANERSRCPRAAALLESAGGQPVSRANDAELLLLNTCVVRQQAEDKIYSRLTYTRELKQRNPRTVVALMGCLVGKNPAEMARLQARFPFVDIFLPPSDLTPLRDYLLTRGLQPPAAENPDDWPPPPLPDSATGRAVVAHLPIVLGCSHACTYCVIPYRRGGEHSRPSAQILAEATRLAERGIREITLLGQIVTATA